MTKGYELEMESKLNNTNANHDDPVLESVKAFPVWPDGATHIIYNIKQNEFASENLGSESATVKSKCWKIACTREQHIRKRVELIENCETYTGSILLPTVTPEELAYIAEIDSKNKGLDDVTDTDVGDWMPEVGDECEAYEYATDQYRKSIYIGVDPRSKESSWKAFSTITTGVPFFSDRYKFPPLKTEAEKEQESLVKTLNDSISAFSCDIYNERMKAGLKKDQCSLDDEDVCRYIVEVLGWRPTK